MDGRELRLRRLMGEGRAVVIAIDHGLFDGPIPAMEDLPSTARKIKPAVDAVLLAPGMVRHCAAVFAGQCCPRTAWRRRCGKAWTSSRNPSHERSRWSSLRKR